MPASVCSAVSILVPHMSIVSDHSGISSGITGSAFSWGYLEVSEE